MTNLSPELLISGVWSTFGPMKEDTEKKSKHVFPYEWEEGKGDKKAR